MLFAVAMLKRLDVSVSVSGLSSCRNWKRLFCVPPLGSHIAAWKEYDPKSPTFPSLTDGGSFAVPASKRNDVDTLSTCPTCTARFHTPYLMQVHFTRCHSRQPQAVNRATCAICERDVRSDVGTASALRTHLLAHEPNDAPYHCKRCSTLMCPFCTYTVVVPSYQRKRPVIRASEFVYHMISHEAEARLGCDHCALSFSTLSEKQKHRKEHTAVNPKWTLTYRNPETRSRQRSRLVCPEQKPQHQCSKCALSSDSGSNHKKCIACITLAFNESLY
ncbi:zinc finger, C2H2 type, partial [Oesophagostomum dentatum]